MEELREGEKKTAKEVTKGTPTRLDWLRLMASWKSVLKVDYRGERIPAQSVEILAIVLNENQLKGKPCKRTKIASEAGQSTSNGKFIKILEAKGLLTNSPGLGYYSTIEGEFLIRDTITNLGRVLLSRPTKRKRIKTEHDRPRPKAPIETFEQLVSETLAKKGLNQRVKYTLLRSLGMNKDQARAALATLDKLKNTERIKPVLKSILSEMVNNTTTENVKSE